MPYLSHRDDDSSDEENSDEEDEAEYEQASMATTRSGRAVGPRNRLNLLNAKDEKEECPVQREECLVQHKSEKKRSAGETEECSDTEPEIDSDSETEDPCNQKKGAGEAEECSDTEPETDSDSAI